MITANELHFGSELPPLEPDPARQISSVEIMIALDKRFRIPIDPSGGYRDIVVSGADITGIFALLEENRQIDYSISFVECRFRSAFFLTGGSFRGSLRFQGTVFHESCAISSCEIADDLTLRDVQVGKLTLREVNSAKVFMSNVRLSTDDMLLLGECAIGWARLYSIEAEGLTVAESRFDELRMDRNPVSQIEISESQITKSLITGGGSRLARLRLRNVTAGGELGIVTDEMPDGASLMIEDCTVAGKLRVLGQGKRCANSQLEIRKTSIQGECSISKPDLAVVQLSRMELDRLRLADATLSKLSLSEVRIAGDVELSQISVRGRLEIERAAIGGRLDLYRVRQPSGISVQPDGSRRSSHVLAIAQTTIGEISCRECFALFNIDIRASTIAGAFELVDCRLGEFSMHDVTIQQQIGLTDCRIGSLDMERGRAAGLRLGLVRGRTLWRRCGSLRLRDSHLGRLLFSAYRERGSDALLPPTIDMRGCTYDDLPRSRYVEEPTQRAAFCEQLVARGPYDPQPYTQMSRMLRLQGHIAAANEIMFKERRAATRHALLAGRHAFSARDYATSAEHYATWAWLWLLRLTIGFGIGLRYFRAVAWALLFVLAGAWVLAGSSEPVGLLPVQTWLWRVGASLDQLLPLVHLSPKYAAFFDERSRDMLNFWQNAYFAMHRLVGWVLGIFIVAGLAGLTQKPAGS